MPDEEINPIIRRTFMRINPDYFTWPIEAQERYRVSPPKKDHFQIEQALIKGLFDVEAKTEKALDEAIDRFSDKQYLAFNAARLPITGIGDDLFFLNECFAEGKTLLDFPTLYDYDYDDFRFQEQARKKDNPDYVLKPYRGSLFSTWARMLIDGKFHYASLSMAAGHIYGELEAFGFDKVEALIPHRFVPGKDHGKREESGTLFSQRIYANGLEAQLEELNDRFFAYTSRRLEELQNEFDVQARKVVYMKSKQLKDDPRMDFVFSDNTVLSSIRFRHFVSDCRTQLADFAELEAIIAQERQAMVEYMETACKDILANFDPKLIPFKKKRKIIVADSALKDLF